MDIKYYLQCNIKQSFFHLSYSKRSMRGKFKEELCPTEFSGVSVMQVFLSPYLQNVCDILCRNSSMF